MFSLGRAREFADAVWNLDCLTSVSRAESFGSLLNQIQLATDEKVREGSLAYFREEVRSHCCAGLGRIADRSLAAAACPPLPTLQFKEQQQAIRADEKTQQAIAAGIKKVCVGARAATPGLGSIRPELSFRLRSSRAIRA